MANKIQSLYEIFRACRLCGAGGGYKMPIIQNFIGFETSDVNLREKILECVQIEVNTGDKMPPLICELCVDKVNDFYEFLAMCKSTNKRTRMRLGLPPQTVPQGANDPDNCILGVTQTICTNKDEPPPQRPGPKSKKRNLSKEPIKQRETIKTEPIDTVKKKDTFQKEEVSKTRNVKPSSTLSAREPVYVTDDEDPPSQRPGPKSKKQNLMKGPIKQAETIKKEQKGVIHKNEVQKKAGGERPERKTLNRELQVLIQSAFPIKNESRTSSSRDTRNSRSSSTSSSSRLRGSSPFARQRPTSPPVRETRQRAISPPVRETRQRAISPSVRETRQRAISPPVRATRQRAISPAVKETRQKSAVGDHLPLSALGKQEPQKRNEKAKPMPLKPFPRTNKKYEDDDSDDCLLVAKRSRVFDLTKLEMPAKKPKLSVKLQKFPAQEFLRSAKETSKTIKEAPKPACKKAKETPTEAKETPKLVNEGLKSDTCHICKQHFKGLSALRSHMRHVHPCTAPRQPEKKQPTPQPVPDVKCGECWQTFSTNSLLAKHKCQGRGGRPGGKCGDCNRSYMTVKTLRAHERVCTGMKEDYRIDADEKVHSKVLSRLKPVQVRVARCDPLLGRVRKQRCDVSTVSPDFGLDRRCVYPYISRVRIKRERLDFDGMVSIKQEIKDEFYVEEDYVHWDSDLSSDSDEDVTDSVLNPCKVKRVDSLTTLSLKTIFSRRCLGKVPRKIRKVKPENLFESLFNADDGNDNMSSDININSIIDNLDVDNDSANITRSVNYDSDSLIHHDKSILPAGGDFDSLIVKTDSDNIVNADISQNNDSAQPVMKNGSTLDGYDTDASIDNVKEDDKEIPLTTGDNTKENSNEKDKVELSRTENNVTNDENENSVPPKSAEDNDCSEASVNDDSKSADDNDGTMNDDESKTNDSQRENSQESDMTETGSTTEVNNRLAVSDPQDTDNIENNELSEDNTDLERSAFNSPLPVDIPEGEPVSHRKETDAVEKIVNGNSVKRVRFDLEYDDKQLMDELDAQIGESDTNDASERDTSGKHDKLTLDDLELGNEMGESSILDNISDEEFNFDA